MPSRDRVSEPAPASVQLFKELASAHRMRFLGELRQRPSSASKLARASGISVQEAMRHLARLRELGLVEQSGSREYSLTPLGTLMARPLEYCDALMAHQQFFASHDTSFVPAHLALTPLLLAPRATADEATHVRDLAAAATRGTQFLCTVSDQALWHDLTNLPGSGAPARLREWSSINTPQVVASEGFLRVPRLIEALAPEPEKVRIRVMLRPELPFMLSVTEGEAWLFLRHRVGLLDLTNAIRANVPVFRDWSLALFRHYENGARVAFDTALGDRLSAWEERMLAAAREVGPAPRMAEAAGPSPAPPLLRNGPSGEGWPRS
jgi:DNA-binding transcriptional ArsR family regulator